MSDGTADAPATTVEPVEPRPSSVAGAGQEITTLRAVVTGCAGFIGSHLSERLVADGWQVVGIDAFTSYYERADKEANLAQLATEPRFRLIEADLARLPLEPLVAGADAVFHLAAQAGVRASFGETFTDYVNDNVLATQRVFEAALATSRPRVVMASSSSVYGDAATYPCRESTTPLRPRSPYGVTKRTCEDLAEVYRTLGLAVIGLRYFTVYGPRQRPDMAIRLLCEAACGGPEFRLLGDGRQSRDFTYVDDVVDATARAARVTLLPAVANVGGGREATMNQVIELIEGLSGNRLAVRREAVQRGDVRRTAADTELARRQLGWRPEVDLVSGLRRQLDWVRSRAERLGRIGATPSAVVAGVAR
ncbi:MAG: GDP-mannose 4,6-dehydratase [Acidimicrobiia bacterium]|nr:GDP-mannose 4,6-dehydratase [Acidimicrobiia bacterium]